MSEPQTANPNSQGKADAAKINRIVAARVTRPAAPVGRNPDACTNELATDIENVDDESGADLCTRCGAQIDHNEPHTECDACRVGGEA